MTIEKKYKFWTILQRICLFSLLAFWAVYAILELVFDIYTPGWVFYVVTVLLIGTFGACITFRGQLMIENGKTNRGTVDGNLGITMFPEPGQIMPLKSFLIFQVYSDGGALAFSSENAEVKSIHEHTYPVVYFPANKEVSYYDDLVIKVPGGKVARQVGIYRYMHDKEVKTVPIVSFLDE